VDSDPSGPYLAAICCVLAAVLTSAAPVWAALLARVPRDANGKRRRWVRVLAFVLLWQSFNLSMLAIWGAVVARSAPEVVLALLIALLLMQPVALGLALRATAER
jgi:hypothetical protein